MRFEVFGREFAWLNNWYSVELAVAYYVWVTIALLGMLQVAAAWFGRRDLAVIPRRRLGIVAGLAVWGLGMLAFYVTQYRLIFVPGPATTEAVVLLSAATVTAVVVTRMVARIVPAGPSNA